MKPRIVRSWLSATVVIVCFSTGYSQPELPRKSPQASTAFTIGLTEVRIDYSSPAVNERTIWGDVVPYDQVWRAGANEATTIEFSTDARVEGQELAKGKYAFFIIPREDGNWTAIFNKDSEQWGAYRYSEDKNALTVEVKPQFKSISQERLTYSIHDQAMDKGYIKFAWEKIRVYLRFSVDVLGPAMTNVREAIAEAEEDEQWMMFAQGADFLLEAEQKMGTAMEWAKTSTDLFDHSWNWWVLARVYAHQEDYASAVECAEKSVELGATSTADNFFKNNGKTIRKDLATWRGKL